MKHQVTWTPSCGRATSASFHSGKYVAGLAWRNVAETIPVRSRWNLCTECNMCPHGILIRWQTLSLTPCLLPLFHSFGRRLCLSIGEKANICQRWGKARYEQDIMYNNNIYVILFNYVLNSKKICSKEAWARETNMNLTVNCLTVEFHLVHYIGHLTKKIYWILQIEASLNPHTVGNQASLPSAFPDASMRSPHKILNFKTSTSLSPILSVVAWLFESHLCSHGLQSPKATVYKVRNIWEKIGPKNQGLLKRPFLPAKSQPQLAPLSQEVIGACLGIFGIFGTDSITIHNLRHYCCDIILWQCWLCHAANGKLPQAQRSSDAYKYAPPMGTLVTHWMNSLFLMCRHIIVLMFLDSRRW